MSENGNGGWLTFRVVTFDVLIPLIKLALLIWTVVRLFQTENPLWGWATIGAILTPGLLEVLYWSAVCCCDPEKRSSSNPWMWILFFNPIAFPLSTILWHLYELRDSSSYNDHFSMFQVLNSLQSFTEAAAITVLQLVILITTWDEPTDDVIVDTLSAITVSTGSQDFDKKNITRYVQIASVVFAVIGLAKDYARHHFHELSGKEKMPGFWISLKGLFFYVLHIGCRIPSLVLLALFFRQYFFILLLLFVLVNIGLSCCFLGRNISKSLWCGFSAVLAPSCFVARAEISTFRHPGRSFYKFYMANTAVFLILTVSAHILADAYFGLRDDTTGQLNSDILSFLIESFKRIPFLDLACAPNYAGCPYVLSAIGTSFAIAEFFLLTIQFSCFPEFLGADLPTVHGM